MNTDTVTGNDNRTYIGYSPKVTARNAYYYRTVTCGNKFDGWRVPNQRELAMMYIGYTDGTTSDNQSSTSMNLGNTEFCATYYSGMNYNVTKTYTRYSWKWTTNDGISMGDTDLPTSTGRVRCIKVVTE